MKKIKYMLFSLTILFLCINEIYAGEKISVTLSQCVDGDTAKFFQNGEKITARFLAIDTPETKHPTKGQEPWGKEASNFTCQALTNAKKIELEYDSDSNKLDKYNRHLVWVWVDDTLLQDEIIKKGYAEVAYLYGDYQYTPLLQDHEAIAHKEQLGVWGDKPPKSVNYWYMITSAIGISILYLISSPKNKTKIKNKIKRTVKKEIQNRL